MSIPLSMDGFLIKARKVSHQGEKSSSSKYEIYKQTKRARMNRIGIKHLSLFTFN